MLGSLPFAVCIVLHYHYHEGIPWYVWIFTIFLCFTDHAVKLKRG